jgi:large subunit ribosomal protein L21e
MKRIGGNRRKTRYMLQKNKSDKGRIFIAKYLQKFKEGDRVLFSADPSYQKGMYFRRFHGKSGIIKKKQGSCYSIQIRDGNKEKNILVHPAHLRKT